MKGFSLIELMVVVAIVAILMAVAIPGYSAWVRKANRADAQQLLLNWSNNQEIWRAGDADYATTDELPAPTLTGYTFTLANRTATTYTLVAIASGDQASDKERSTPCSSLTVNQTGRKTPPVCWQE
jgi:type IV pilus assembly protein PilE